MKTSAERTGNIWERLKSFLCCGTYSIFDEAEDNSICLSSEKLGIVDEENEKSSIINLDTGKYHRTRRLKGLDVEKINNLDSNDIDAESDDVMPIEIDGECLPEKNDGKPTLVLDLDNTLLFPTNKKPDEYTQEISLIYNGRKQSIWFIERPHLQEFLEELHRKYEIVVFTAGIKQYGMKIIRRIDKKNRIKYLLDRRFCTVYGKNSRNQDLYIKDLRILGRDLRRTIIIDDREYSYILQISNGQWIPAFNGETEDTALLKLKEYLLEIADLEDLRQRKYFSYV